MTILYNCKHAGDQYRITKFNSEGDPESSYLTTFEECDCPAGKRPMCRHREMLPKFIQRGAVDTGWFFDYDRGGWVDNRTEDELEQVTFEPMPPLPDGVQVFSLDDPAELHNAIAEAVGEDLNAFVNGSPEPSPEQLKGFAPAPAKRKKDGRRL